MSAGNHNVTSSKQRGPVIVVTAIALAFLASCSSKSLVAEPGGAGEGASGGSDGGSGGDSATGADGGTSVAGSEGGAVGCYAGRELVDGVTVVACSPAPQTLVLGPTEVYWLDWDGGAEPPAGAILAASKEGGASRHLGSARNLSAILQTDGEDVFWTDHRDDYKDGVLRRTSIAAGEEAVLVEGVYLASALALDESYVYFGTVAEAEVDGLARVAKSGGLPEVLISGNLVGAMASMNAELFWVEVRSEPLQAGLYERFSSVYRAMPDDAAAPTLLAEVGRDDPVALVTTEDFVLWTFGVLGEFWRVGRDGTDARMIAEGNVDTWRLGTTLATDGTSLYFSRHDWTTPDDGNSRDALVRSSLDGNGIVELTRAVTIVDQAVDDEFVYFTGIVEAPESRLSGVFRMPK